MGWSQTFVPGQYEVRPWASANELFWNPELGPGGILGPDNRIWQYNVYPQNPFLKQGSDASHIVYWLAMTAGVDIPPFGWKTATNHWNDEGGFGHVGANGNPLRDWRELCDPRSGQILDLSFAQRSFPIAGINKDLRNTSTATANCVEIVVAGIHEITWHYDDSPPWPTFQVTYAGGNTVLRWCGKDVPPPGVVTHVGFEMAGSSASIVSMSWLAGTTVIGVPIQATTTSGAMAVLWFYKTTLCPDLCSCLAARSNFTRTPCRWIS